MSRSSEKLAAGARNAAAALFFALGTASLWSPAAAGAELEGAARRPNVLLVITDDQRPDTVHALGNPIIETPTLDKLVREGTAFTRAIAPCPLCVPSRAEIMTSREGFRNGVSAFGGRIDPGLTLWADAMRRAGYHAWYVGKWMNDGRPTTRGYDESRGLFAGGGGRFPLTHPVDHHGRPVTGYRGWLFQTDAGELKPELGMGLTPEISRHIADAAIEFLRRPTEKPFFLHVNFTAPHDPLLMPPGYEGKYDPAEMPLPPNFRPRHPFDHGNLEGRDEKLLPWPRTPEDVCADLAVYYAVLTHMDAQLGRILDALEATGQSKNTIVVFSSDHGLAMGSHGLRGKQNMYEHTVGVPLVMRGPGIPAGRRCDAPCYLRDLYPTVCELAGVPIPGTVTGRSLAPVLRGEAESVRDCVFGHFRDVQRMVRTDRWKLIQYPKAGRLQLFDLEADPYEIHDRSGDPACADVLAELRGKLKAWQREVGDPLLASSGGKK